MARRLRTFSICEWMNFCPPKPGFTDADQIDHVENRLDCTDRGTGVQRHTRLHPGTLDRLQGPVDMRAGLDMGGQDVRAGIGKGVDIGIDWRNHQVHIHHRLDVLADRLDQGRAKGEVRNEMTVHHVHVDPVRAFGLDRFDLGSEIGEIRRQNGRRDFQVAIKSHGSPHRLLRPT